MKKPRVLFPFTEAGLGHIMPLRSILDAFREKYGDKVEIIENWFFTESGDPTLKRFEAAMCLFVKEQNKHNKLGFASTWAMNFFGRRIGMWYTMHSLSPFSTSHGIRYMEKLAPDLVVSTHWATHYYARHAKHKPLTAMYCPDAHINPLFAYPSDLTMVSMRPGFEMAKEQYRHLTDDNLKLVPFCIRKEAFDISSDKVKNREQLGLPLDKFTILLAEGGYGIGKMQAICEEIIRLDLPVTLIPVCGKNEELYQHFKSLSTGENITFLPQGFSQDILHYIAASDLFLGKSGNIIAEPTFYGVPSIITKHTTHIERIIAEYYVDTVGCALNIFEVDEIVNKIIDFLEHPEFLAPLIENAKAHRSNYGAEKTADEIFSLLLTRFPELREEVASVGV